MTDRTVIEGICLAATDKAILLGVDNSDDEYWLPLRYVRVVSGHVGRGAWCEISVPDWLYDEKTGVSGKSEGSAAKIPPDMLQRLIALCHPSRHSDMAEASTAAHNWLLQVKHSGHR